MKYIILASLLFIINSFNGQEKETKIVNTVKPKVNSKTVNNSSKNHIMEYFNINKYKNLEVDTEWSSTEIDKFLVKGNERVRISFYEEGIQLREQIVNSPYEIVKGFSNKTKKLLIVGKEFYKIPFGIDMTYDETGKPIKETNYDKPYKFSIHDLIEKVKKEYSIDLEDKKQGGSVRRFEEPKLNNKAFYEVTFESKENPLKRDYILIDGTTGETLYKSYYFTKGEGEYPYDVYLKNLKSMS